MYKLILILTILLFPLLLLGQKNLSWEEKMSDQYKVKLPAKSPTTTHKLEGNKLKTTQTSSANCSNNATTQMQALQKQRKRIVETLANQQKAPNADPAYIKKCEKALVLTDKEILALEQKVDTEKKKSQSKQK